MTPEELCTSLRLVRISAHDTRGIIKLAVDKKSNILIGAQILATNAGDIIQSAALMVYFGKRYGVTLDEFLELPFPYLTQVEGLKLAIQALNNDVTKLSCCA